MPCVSRILSLSKGSRLDRAQHERHLSVCLPSASSAPLRAKWPHAEAQRTLRGALNKNAHRVYSARTAKGQAVAR